MDNENRKKLYRELAALSYQEKEMQRRAEKTLIDYKKAELEGRIPDKVKDNLKKAFSKALYIICCKGNGITGFGIKTVNRNTDETGNRHECKAENPDTLSNRNRETASSENKDIGSEENSDFKLNLCEFEEKGNCDEFEKAKNLGESEKNGGDELNTLKEKDLAIDKKIRANLAASTVEGIGLGVLGIGLPDIMLFSAMILRGIYEIAAQYGYDYEDPKERYFIMKLIEGAMSKGKARRKISEETDLLILNGVETVGEDEWKLQCEKAGRTLAMDMLVLKFIQGIPVAGVIGGAANPLYYSGIIRYAKLKYKKRIILEQLEMK